MIAEADGTTYTFPYPYTGAYVSNLDGNGQQVGTTSVLPTSIEDRNGNMINFSVSATGGIVTDTLKRTALAINTVVSDNQLTATNIAVTGTPNPYQLNWSQISLSFNSQPFPFQLVNIAPSGFSCGPTSSSPSHSQGSLVVPSSFALPDGTNFQFFYDASYGLINKIVYPNGAYISYSWGLPSGVSDAANYTWTSMGSFYNNFTYTQVLCAMRYAVPVILHRYVSFDGSTIAQQQDFTYSTQFSSPTMVNQGWTAKTTTVVTTDYVANTSYTTTYNYVPTNTYMSLPTLMYGESASSFSGSGLPAVESSVVVNGSNGGLLRTTNKTWQDPSRPLSVQTVLDTSGKTSEIDYTYGSGMIPQLSEIDVYDYGNGAKGSLLQKTSINYASFDVTPIFPGIAGTPTPALTNLSSLLSFPSSEQIYNGSGTKMAETDYLYDETVVSPAAATQHDEQNYDPSLTPPRANVTTVRKKCLQGCSTDAVTTYAYDEAGQLTSLTDPCGNVACLDMTGSEHTVTYSYSDSFTGGTGQPPSATDAYVTNIVRPSINGVNFIEKFQYGYNDGRIRQAVDENNQTTTFCYLTGGCSGTVVDPWGRLTQVNYPDGGSTTASYLDSGPNPATSISKRINSTSTEVNTTVFDGMGHAVQAQANSDPAGTVYADTIYDGRGNVYELGKPTRCSSSPGTMPASCQESSWGFTKLNYDALGHKTLQINSDNTRESWLYSGNSMSFTNENGFTWQQVADARGLLTQVAEPGSLVTYYAYDALGNMTCAAQDGGTQGIFTSCAQMSGTWRPRSFAYDSLSRQISAINPETGQVRYSYDANDNLNTKTAPLPNQAGAGTIVTNYSYDALNRLLSKTYTNGPAGTLSNCYLYDTATNGVDRLAMEWTQAGGCASSPSPDYQSLRAYGAYDAMGRAVTEQQCVAGYCTSTSVPSQPQANCSALTTVAGLQFCYDLAGNLLAHNSGVTTAAAGNYPQAAINFSQVFDTTGRLDTVSSSFTDTTHPQQLFHAQGYTPANMLVSWLLGTNLYTSRNYDSRLRVCSQASAVGQSAPAAQCDQ